MDNVYRPISIIGSTAVTAARSADRRPRYWSHLSRTKRIAKEILKLLYPPVFTCRNFITPIILRKLEFGGYQAVKEFRQ